MRCLCCNKEINNPSKQEIRNSWHDRCIKKFFGLSLMPEFDISEKKLEQLADSSVSKGLTVPGVQKKLSLHLETDNKTGRLTIVDYPTGYILKPESLEYDALPEAEFLSMKLAELAGIKTVPCALLKIDDTFAYITKRIDRSRDRMLAMEDFCQLSNRITADKYKGSYEGCGKVIQKYSKNVGIDEAEFFYRLIFCFITGNSDMHLKNFSLIEDAPKSRVFGLSAAYDMLPVNVIMPQDKDQMALTVNGKKRNIRQKDFLVLAESIGVSIITAKRLISRILKLTDKMLVEVDQSYVPDYMKEDLKRLIMERCEIVL